MVRINTLQRQWSSKTFYVCEFSLVAIYESHQFHLTIFQQRIERVPMVKISSPNFIFERWISQIWVWNRVHSQKCRKFIRSTMKPVLRDALFIMDAKSRKVYILKIYSTLINLSGFHWLILMWPFVYGTKICAGFQTFQFMCGWSMKILLTNHEKSAAVAFLSAIICFLNPSWCSWDIMHN